MAPNPEHRRITITIRNRIRKGEDSGSESRYHAGLAQIRAGMDALWELYRDLDQGDAEPQVRATLLKLLHDLDEMLQRETQPPPRFGAASSASEPRIQPHLEPADEPTPPEAGG